MSKDKHLLALIKEPRKKPYRAAIENSLKAFQDKVGGNIECFAIAEDLTIICNEEGKLLGLEPNVEMFGEQFVGTIILIGVDEDDPSEFDDLILTEKQLRRLLPQLWGES